MGNCMAVDDSKDPAARNIWRWFKSNQELTQLSNNLDSRSYQQNGSSSSNANSNNNNQMIPFRHGNHLDACDLPTPLRTSSRHLNNLNSGVCHDHCNNNNHAIKDGSICVSHISNNNIKSSDTLVNGNTKSHLAIKGNNDKFMNNSAQQQQVMICLAEFDSREEGDLSFKKGDRLAICDKPCPDWWFAEHLTTKQRGYVPTSFIAAEAIEMEDWFFPRINRREAENLLASRNNCRGTFLIRYSENSKSGYSLSIRDEDSNKGEHVKHYRIKKMDNGGYYVSQNVNFPTMTSLIAYYSKSPSGLCYRLVKPCPKPEPSYWPGRNDELQRNELKSLRKIGTGCFGEVFYGYYMNRRNEVAIKTLKQGTMSRQAFLEEAGVMRRCRHENLVALYGVCSRDEPLLIVTEYMCNGSLLDYLRNNPEGRSLKLPDLMDMASQVANGMAHLEQVKLIHRDLAARNILVGQNHEVKVADFGLARVIEDSEYTARLGAKFPIKWTAPEAAMYGKFSIKSDVWSYGILLYELVTHGAVPYLSMTNKEVVDQIQRGYRLPRPSDCPIEVYNKMRDCWNVDPDKRPTFEYLANHFKYFNVSTEQSYRDAADMF